MGPFPIHEYTCIPIVDEIWYNSSSFCLPCFVISYVLKMINKNLCKSYQISKLSDNIAFQMRKIQ